MSEPVPEPEGPGLPVREEPARSPGRSNPALRRLRVWLYPFLILASAATALLVGGFWVDASLAGRSPGLFRIYTHLEGSDVAGVLGNVGQVVTQILGVAISVVAIIVELAANRYTHRITELFFRAPVNFVVMGLFVIAGLDGLWVSLMYRDGFVPVASTLATMVLMSLCLLILLPYFAYVFEFLNPMNIVARLRAVTLAVVSSAPRRIALAREHADQAQHAAADGTEQLSDVALNAMVNHDKAIAMSAVNALGDLARDYLEVKGALPLDWFLITDDVAHNPDFVSMAREVLVDVGRARTWFEFKLLRQFQTIYQAALGQSRELCYLVAIHTRELAERALEHGDRRVVELALKFFNTYLRATVNAKDIRTAYNVLNQYRLLAEHALNRREGAVAVEVARYFKYYGQLAFHMDLGFILETAAYDLCALNELAFDLAAPERPDLLRIFLQVDKEGEGAAREASLRGVRKAQVKLATYYLVHDDVTAAREVYRDMRNEKPARLASIRDELLSIASAHFWEITDRGTNFDYIPVERKRRLIEFFEWFSGTLPAPRASIVPSSPPVPAPVEAPRDSAVVASSRAEAEAEAATSDPRD